MRYINLHLHLHYINNKIYCNLFCSTYHTVARSSIPIVSHNGCSNTMASLDNKS